MVIALESQADASSETNVLLEVWDIEKTALVETYVTRSTEASIKALPELVAPPAVEAEASPADAIAALVRARQQSSDMFIRRAQTTTQEAVPPPSSDVQALLVGLDFGGYTSSQRTDVVDLSTDFTPRASSHRGFMISGSEDRKIRLWDLARTERSVVLSGSQLEVEKPVYRYVCELYLPPFSC